MHAAPRPACAKVNGAVSGKAHSDIRLDCSRVEPLRKFSFRFAVQMNAGFGKGPVFARVYLSA